MKKRSIVLITVFSLFILTACNAEVSETKVEEGITWYTNLEEALEVAQEKDVPVFIHFTGSDWCGWCWKLEEEVYSKQVFQDYIAQNLVMVKIDFPRKIQLPKEVQAYNRNLANKYGIRGFPTVQLLNPDGSAIAQTGYQYGGAEVYIDHLKELLTNN
ncbi:MAG: thioredoxin family protein [Candidatus Cloacimonetes bacterium]|nr:thioredoxin family protein [Candidatus Cloacimonadota bacterium]